MANLKAMSYGKTDIQRSFNHRSQLENILFNASIFFTRDILLLVS